MHWCQAWDYTIHNLIPLSILRHPQTKMLRQNKNTSTSLLNLSIGDVGGSHPQGQSQFWELDTLPKQFVLSMKKLFDILDDKQTGYVRFTDIEKGWQDDGSKDCHAELWTHSVGSLPAADFSPSSGSAPASSCACSAISKTLWKT